MYSEDVCDTMMSLLQRTALNELEETPTDVLTIFLHRCELGEDYETAVIFRDELNRRDECQER